MTRDGNRDKQRKEAISGLVSAVKKAGIDAGCRDDIPEDMVNAAILKEQKIAKEQLDQCPDSRQDLKAEYQFKYDVISEYAPKMMSEDEIKEYITEKFSEIIAAKDKGAAMKAIMPGRKYFFIISDGQKVGAINIGNKPRDNDNTIFHISPLFILPEFQNQGIGHAAIRKVFEMHPEATAWRLATILQEPANCHLYEKCGFERTGEKTVINEKMTIIGYEKRIK